MSRKKRCDLKIVVEIVVRGLILGFEFLKASLMFMFRRR